VTQPHEMTIGRLSRRAGVPIKALRDYERRGFLYTQGRSEGNYRLFGEEALWCVRVVQELRLLGLTLNEIEALVISYADGPSEALSALLDTQLARAESRVATRIADLQALQGRIHVFQAARAGIAAQPSEPPALVRLLASDPRRATGDAVPDFPSSSS